MQERPTGLVRGQRSLGNGLPRRILFLLVAALPASVRANEPGEAPIVTIKPAERAAAPGTAGEQPRTDRVASVDRAPKTRLVLKPAADRFTSATSEMSPIDRAVRTISDCQARYQTIEDYTCTFYKRERIEGRTTP